MPYIPEEDKKKYEPALTQLRAKLKELNLGDGVAKGELTYLVFALGLEFFKNRESYTNISNSISCLNDAAEEIRRRCLNDYENKKIQENGDVL